MTRHDWARLNEFIRPRKRRQSGSPESACKQLTIIRHNGVVTEGILTTGELFLDVGFPLENLKANAQHLGRKYGADVVLFIERSYMDTLVLGLEGTNYYSQLETLRTMLTDNAVPISRKPDAPVVIYTALHGLGSQEGSSFFLFDLFQAPWAAHLLPSSCRLVIGLETGLELGAFSSLAVDFMGGRVDGFSGIDTEDLTPEILCRWKSEPEAVVRHLEHRFKKPVFGFFAREEVWQNLLEKAEMGSKHAWAFFFGALQEGDIRYAPKSLSFRLVLIINRLCQIF